MSDGYYDLKAQAKRDYARLDDRAKAIGVDPSEYGEWHRGERFHSGGSLEALESAVILAEQLARPCMGCEKSGERTHRFYCDDCLADQSAEREAMAERLRRENEQRAEAQRFIGRMPAGRREMLEHSGLTFASPEDAYAEAYGEW